MARNFSTPSSEAASHVMSGDVGSPLRLVKNFGVLFSGNSIATVFGLVSWALTARALGVDRFGVLVLIQTYVLTIDAVVNFQSWQATIYYGAKAIERRRDDELADVVKFGLAIDLGSALAGTVLALGGAYLFCQWQGWGQAHLIMIALYSLTIAFNISGTPTAALRLFNRFDHLALQQTLTAGARLALVTGIFFGYPTLWGFLLAWMLTEIGGSVLLLALGRRELGHRGLRFMKDGQIRQAVRRHGDIWRFYLITNVDSSIKYGGRQLDILLLGALVAPSAAGIIKIIKLFTKALGALSAPLQQSIYPDLALLWSSQNLKKFKAQIIRAGLLGGAVGLAVWGGVLVVGPWILDTMFGKEYQDAYVPLLVYLAPSALSLFAIANPSALLSMGKVKAIFITNVASWVAYFVALPILTVQLSILGAAIAQSVHNAVWVTTTVYLILVAIRRRTGGEMTRPTVASEQSPTTFPAR